MIVARYIIAAFLLFILKTNANLATEKDLEGMRTAILENYAEVALSVNFIEHNKNPYPKNFKGYNVDIDYSRHCYVVFTNEQKSSYKLVESATQPVGEFGVFLTHTGPCGVCSSLQDLATYISLPDLATPVSKCAKILLPEKKKNCLRKLGFSEPCMYIWYWNTIYTRRGCLNICLRYQRKKRNEPIGKYNPCKPRDDVTLPLTQEEDPDYENPSLVPETDDPNPQTTANALTKSHRRRKGTSLGNPMFSSGKSVVLSFLSKRKTGCKNSINRQPACKEHQWQNNPYRLNPCIQCDECKSGPMFQKVSGRQRRNSGIASGIDRPDVTDRITHHRYFTLEVT